LITDIDKQHWRNLPRVATLSHDPDTQTACIVTDDRRVMISAHSNSLPFGVTKTDERTTRPLKYSYIGHAENSALARLAGSHASCAGGTLYLNWFPCSTCAIAIINAGIKRLVADQAAYKARKDDPRYGFGPAMEMLIEAGAQIDWMEP
jgi:deoxycytidylate deaminase